MTINYIDAVKEPLPAASTLIYTTPSVNDARIVSCIVRNTSTANVSITVNIVQSGDSAGVTNEYVSRPIAAKTTPVLSEIIGSVLKTGDKIYSTAGTANALNLKVGIKETTT